MSNFFFIQKKKEKEKKKGFFEMLGKTKTIERGSGSMAMGHNWSDYILIGQVWKTGTPVIIDHY